MAQSITTTSGTGTVAKVSIGPGPIPGTQAFGQDSIISVTLDNGGGTFDATTLTPPSVIAGDRVRVTITDGPLGKLISDVTKI